MPVDDDTILTTAEAAALVNVSDATIRKWVSRGHLVWDPDHTPEARHDERGRRHGYRFRAGDVRRAAAERNTAAQALRAQRRT